MASHFEAARGAYVMRDFAIGRRPVGGTVYVQGTSPPPTSSRSCRELDEARTQREDRGRPSARSCSPCRTDAYRERIRSEADRWDGMAITNRAFKLDARLGRRPDWRASTRSRSDWDDRWRTGGTVDEVIDEAHLGHDHIFEAIQRYATDRAERHRRLRAVVDAIDGGE